MLVRGRQPDATPLTEEQRELAGRWLPKAMGHARRASLRHPRADGEFHDACIDALIRSVRRWHPSRHGFFPHYLNSSLRNAVASLIRRMGQCDNWMWARPSRHRGLGMAEGPERMVDNRGPDWWLSHTEELALLRRAVDKLPDRHRRIVMVHDYEGGTYTQAGKAIGVNKNRARVLRSKAIDMLRELLGVAV